MGIVLPQSPQDGGDVSDVSGLRTSLIWIAIFGSGLAIGIALGDRTPESNAEAATITSINSQTIALTLQIANTDGIVQSDS